MEEKLVTNGRNTEGSSNVQHAARPAWPHLELMKAAAYTLERTEQGSREYDIAAFALHHAMTGSHREVLEQLIKQGPVEDGDVISKSNRDALIALGLASRVVYRGQQGYTAANYIGWDVYRAGTK